MTGSALGWIGLALWLYQAVLFGLGARVSQQTGRAVTVGVLPGIVGTICLLVWLAVRT